MPRVKIDTSVGIRRKKIIGKTAKEDLKIGEVPVMHVNVKTGVIPAKTVAVKAISARRNKLSERLVASMDLDEMLEASRIVEMGLRGEKIPTVKSSKVKKYIGEVMRLNKKNFTKPIVKKMQQDLTVQIVERNKQTANAIDAKRLYHILMNEE